MGLARLCTRFLGADDGMKAQFSIHIFMDRCLTVVVPPAFQKDRHVAVLLYSIVAAADLFNLLLGLCFLGVITRLPVFPIVIAGIRADRQPQQQPADSEFNFDYIALVTPVITLL